MELRFVAMVLILLPEVAQTSVIRSPCYPNPCSNNGDCFATIDALRGFVCICSKNFSGVRCNQREIAAEQREENLYDLNVALLVFAAFWAVASCVFFASFLCHHWNNDDDGKEDPQPPRISATTVPSTESPKSTASTQTPRTVNDDDDEVMVEPSASAARPINEDQLRMQLAATRLLHRYHYQQRNRNGRRAHLPWDDIEMRKQGLVDSECHRAYHLSDPASTDKEQPYVHDGVVQRYSGLPPAPPLSLNAE